MVSILGICAGVLLLPLLPLEFGGRVMADGQIAEVKIQTECRDRYLWLHVASAGAQPQFEAIDETGVHSIDGQHASQCGYTISTFKMDGYTTFRASYYSCYTANQNDESFTFNLNIIVSNARGQLSSHPLTKTCSPLLPWSQREVICEEDYMEVIISRDISCEGHQSSSSQAWQAAYSLAQRMATSAWKLVFIQDDEEMTIISVNNAYRLGYSLSQALKRVVFRSPYNQPQAQTVLVDGVPVEVIQGSLFYRQKLVVIMMDVSMACTESRNRGTLAKQEIDVPNLEEKRECRIYNRLKASVKCLMGLSSDTEDSGSFDGARLLWDIPKVISPLVWSGARFQSKSINVGVEGQLLDPHSTIARGFTVSHHGALVQIGVPFGAEGGYSRSSVVNNVYREMYVIFLFYEHVFSLLHEDGTSVETRHRLLRVVDTPMRCQQPYTIDQTKSDEYMFTMYLGNIPSDVTLEGVKINGKLVSVMEAAEFGYSISKTLHTNGSQAYTLGVPFDSRVVHRMYLGEGLVEYSLDLNYTLTIMPQREHYNHHTFVVAQLHNTYPPEIQAQCREQGIVFRMIKQKRMDSLWEVGIDQEPLTTELATERGYRLQNDSHSITLEVPMFSIGYAYENINLHDFYGTFKLLLRDSKTLEVQTSTSKRCLFKTEELIVCSSDGTMTVVTTPTMTWPTVQPHRTTLLDRMCGPKQTDQSRVLFEFSLDSCGTRVMTGESYVVYENEILYDRQLLADKTALISRDSKFKLTVRCFYPLNAVKNLYVDRIFGPGAPGFGSIKVLQNTEDGTNKLPHHHCPRQQSAGTIGTSFGEQIAATEIHLYPIGPHAKPGPSRFTVQGGTPRLHPVTVEGYRPNLSQSGYLGSWEELVPGSLNSDLTDLYNSDPFQMGNMAPFQVDLEPQTQLDYGPYQATGKLYKSVISGLVPSREWKFVPVTSMNGNIAPQDDNTFQKNPQISVQSMNIQINPLEHRNFVGPSKQDKAEPVHPDETGDPQRVRVEARSKLFPTEILNQKAINPYGSLQNDSNKGAPTYQSSQTTSSKPTTNPSRTSNEDFTQKAASTKRYALKQKTLFQQQAQLVPKQEATPSNVKVTPAPTLGNLSHLSRRLEGQWSGYSGEETDSSTVMKTPAASHIKIKPHPRTHKRQSHQQVTIYPVTSRYEKSQVFSHPLNSKVPSLGTAEQENIKSEGLHSQKPIQVNLRVSSLPNMLVTGQGEKVKPNSSFSAWSEEKSHYEGSQPPAAELSPSLQVSLINPVSQHGNETVNVRTGPASGKSAPSPNDPKHLFHQYRGLLSSDVNPASSQVPRPNASQPANLFEFPLKNKEPATSHIERFSGQRKPPHQQTPNGTDETNYASVYNQRRPQDLDEDRIPIETNGVFQGTKTNAEISHPDSIFHTLARWHHTPRAGR